MTKRLVLGLCHVLLRKQGQLLVGFNLVSTRWEKELVASMNHSFYSVTCFMCRNQFQHPKEKLARGVMIRKIHVVGRPLEQNVTKLNTGPSCNSEYATIHTL